MSKYSISKCEECMCMSSFSLVRILTLDKEKMSMKSAHIVSYGKTKVSPELTLLNEVDILPIGKLTLLDEFYLLCKLLIGQ